MKGRADADTADLTRRLFRTPTRAPVRRSCCCTPHCTTAPTSSRCTTRWPPVAACWRWIGPGHGDSPPPATPLRAVQFGDLLVEFADQLDLNNLVVVGNSVGGYAACRLALERRRSGAQASCSSTPAASRRTARSPGCSVRRWAAPRWSKAVFPVFVRAYMRAKNLGRQGASCARVAARAKTDDGARTAAALWKSFTEPGHDLRARAAQITVAPVLITWGAEDLTAPLRWGKVGAGPRFPGPRFDDAADGPRRVLLRAGRRGWLAGTAVRRRRARRARRVLRR